MAAGPVQATARPALRRRAGAGTEALQRRMKVGAAGDRFEREADRIADHVAGPSALPAAAPPPVISPLSVQRTPADEPDTGPEEPAQRAARATGPEASKDKGEDLTEALTAQRDAVGPGAAGGAAPAGIEAGIQGMRAGPAPGLDSGTRGTMERNMGVDLGGVRVHTGDSAARAAHSLNAKAFTVGQDMFFGRGQYDPVSAPGRRLIAHEAAHTVQQRGGSAGVQRIQRAGGTTKKLSVIEDEKDPSWKVDLSRKIKKLTVPQLELPKVAGGLKGTTDGPTPKADKRRSLPKAGAPFIRLPRGEREAADASVKWRTKAKGKYSDNFKKKLNEKLNDQQAAQNDVEGVGGEGRQDVFFLYTGARAAGKANLIVTGTLDKLAEHDSVLRPMVSRTGRWTLYDVDHILEYQLGGADEFENMWLLDRSYNRSVGAKLKAHLNSTITTHLGKAEERLKELKAEPTETLPKDPKTVKANWEIVFKTVVEGKNYAKGTRNYWTRDDMKDMEPLNFFRFMTLGEIANQGMDFKKNVVPKRINVFPYETGGWRIPFRVANGGKKLKRPHWFYSGMEVTDDADLELPTATRKGHAMAEIPVKYTRKNPETRVIEAGNWFAEIIHSPKLGFGGYVSKYSIREQFKAGKVKFAAVRLSPISFSDAGINTEGQLEATGEVLSTKALLPGLKVPIRLKGEEVFLDFPLSPADLKFGPVRVTETTLRLGVGPTGFFVTGLVGLSVDKVGQGALEAKTTKADTLIKGKFAFDFNFAKNAELDAQYSLKTDAFRIKGRLTAKRGSLPGVEGGNIDIDVSNDSFGLTGTLMLGGVLKGNAITVGYTPEAGLVIEGKDIPLPVDKLPGVSDAKVTVRAQRNPEGAWLISGAGSAALKAPGASGTLDVTLNGEAVRFHSRDVELAKGPAKGYIEITATNMAMDDQGNPVEGGPVGELKIWGKGQASIAFGKVLTGTAAIEYTRDGRIIITGEIALPPTVDVFPRVPDPPYRIRDYKTRPIEFPIWGVKLGPVGIAISAFVDARMDFLAYVGPGQLRDTKVTATMDLDNPADASVEGTANFHVPAWAGFRLDLGGGLKAQAAVAYVKGRVGLDGTLGVAGGASMDVGVKWSAAQGFEADVVAKVEGSTKFELGVNASITAGVDLVVKTLKKTWGPWHKKLGEFGPNMKLSAEFPIKYTERDGLDLDFRAIRPTKPRLDAETMMKSAFDTLV